VSDVTVTQVARKLDRVREAPAALPAGGLAGQDGEQMPQLAASSTQEAPVGRDAHDRPGDAERDRLRIGDLPAGVPSRLRQKVVGCAMADGAESVEVGVRRGLRAGGVSGTVGFGLSALLFSDRLDPVGSII
jgi:hypothetical protein